MTTILTIQFTSRELQWLQWFLQQLNEEKWPGSKSVTQMGTQEHAWFQDFLNKVRLCIMNPNGSVSFTDKAQLDFIKNLFTMYKNNAGEYIFTGVWGDNVRIGQFPTATGSANSFIRGQGSFPEEQFLRGADIFNNILHKLGEIIYPPYSQTYASAGG